MPAVTFHSMSLGRYSTISCKVEGTHPRMMRRVVGHDHGAAGWVSAGEEQGCRRDLCGCGSLACVRSRVDDALFHGRQMLCQVFKGITSGNRCELVGIVLGKADQEIG